ncbi:MAG: NYN domain-containing protein [Acidimicrobiales bacterium]
MGRLAIFLDGGYVSSITRSAGSRPDFAKMSTEISAEIDRRTTEPVELLRTLYYNCLPYQGARPTPEEAERYGKTQAFYSTLNRLPRFEVRLGRLEYRGLDAAGKPIFQQKRVDLMLGLDVASLASKHQVNHAAIVAGDSDFLPAVTLAKQEGVCVWLVHGPGRSAAGQSTYHHDLWDAVDERIELDAAFLARIER